MMPNKKILMTALLMAGLACGAAQAVQPAANADTDLYRAAKLHRGGDTPAAMAIWRKWAEQGNADAAYNLALIHQHADGVAYDAAAALRWYRVAAERGDKSAQIRLGLMYQNGEGVAVDAAQAHQWFTLNRQQHAHHQHHAQFQQWQQQARALIEERDRREALAAARRDGERIMAELRQRAATVAEALPARDLAIASAAGTAR
jgi:TPR repeat protein